MRGRKRKPTVLRVIEGTNDRARYRRRVGEPRPVGELRDPPLWFNAGQKSLWQHALDNSPPQLLTKLEHSVLVNWVVAAYAMEEMTKRWNELGNPITALNGLGAVVTHPLIGALQKQSFTVTRAAGELGFSPTARGRITLSEAPDGDDPAEAFFTR